MRWRSASEILTSRDPPTSPFLRFGVAVSTRSMSLFGAPPTIRGAMRLDRQLASKVPEITAAFWVTKVLTTAMGESISDYSVHRFDPVVAVAFGFVAFAIAI